jgi:16S rRNA G966 N2-methylase RsmD
MNNYKLIKSDVEGDYSISHQEDADKLSDIIKTKFGNPHIMDATAGVGGNSISFGKYFNNVTSIEIHKERFQFLKQNLETFKINNNLINDDFLNHIDKDYDVIFVDPPWGGPSYKYHKLLRLSVSDKNLMEITKLIINKNKIIIWKLPFNYDLSEFSMFNYEIHNIKNYLIIIVNS